MGESKTGSEQSPPPKPPPSPWSNEVMAIATVGQCPPADAKPCDGLLFRYNGAPADWLTYVARGKSKPSHKLEKKCDFAALSCFVSATWIEQTMKLGEIKGSIARDLVEKLLDGKREIKVGHKSRYRAQLRERTKDGHAARRLLDLEEESPKRSNKDERG